MSRRITCFFTILMLIAAGMMVRVACLGVSPVLTETARRQQAYRLPVSAGRGLLFDCSLHPLTDRETAWQAVVLPEPEVVGELTRMGCSLRRAELAEKVSEGRPFVVAVASPETDDPNITVCQATRRTGTNPLALHTLGYTNADGAGVSGIERAYDSFLTEYAHPVTAVCARSGSGELLGDNQVTLQVDGNPKAGVVLTLDARIQDLVERACAGLQKGAAVVLDAKTADIRAIASFPSFSLDNLPAAVADTANAPLLNRALQPFPVGSTFKIATAATALDAGVPVSRSYTCTGSVSIGQQTYHCHHLAGHGTLDMKGAFVDSCNPYFITLGQQLGGRALRQTATALGFGREIPLADGLTAAAGTLPDAEMSAGELANFSFGQGMLTATPLQVAQMVYAAAGDGSVLQPRLVEGTTLDGQAIQQAAPAAPIQAMSPQAAAAIRSFMVQTVAGTAAQPALTTAGGKSATAQTGNRNADGSEEYCVWFAGFFPADNPRYIAVVLLEGGKSGTADAGPVFARIADYVTALDNADTEQGG